MILVCKLCGLRYRMDKKFESYEGQGKNNKRYKRFKGVTKKKYEHRQKRYKKALQTPSL
mgnify:CR=1 FL=1